MTTARKKKSSKKKAEKKITKKVTKKAEAKGFSLADIESELKKFKVMVMTKDKTADKIPYRIPFRHKGLQKATGGIMGGKFSEISGNSQSGKSFLLYELMAECQKMGGVCLLFDGERAFEESYADIVGIDMKAGTFMLTYETNMDSIFTIINKFVGSVRKKKKKIPILIGLDSFPTIQHPVDLEKMEKGDNPRGFAAMQKNGRFSYHIEKYTTWFGKHDVTFVLLNQTRTKVDTQTGMTSTITLCEEVIQFYTTQRIQGKLRGRLVKEVPSIENKKGKVKIQIGMKTVWETIKNRSVKPFQKILTKIRYANGIELYSGLDEVLVNAELIRKSTTKFKQDGSEVDGRSKGVEGFRLVTETEEKKFYYSIKDLVEEFPEFLEPSWTGTYDDGEGVDDEL